MKRKKGEIILLLNILTSLVLIITAWYMLRIILPASQFCQKCIFHSLLPFSCQFLHQSNIVLQTQNCKASVVHVFIITVYTENAVETVCMLYHVM